MAKNVNKLYEFWDPPETFSIGPKINKGASGVIYRGTFGSRVVAIKVNNPAAVKLQADADEVRMQSRLFCHVRDHAAEFRGSARIRRPSFPSGSHASDARWRWNRWTKVC